MAETGTVFNIQRFSTHDGPGIRTTVFFKGCPLSCKWCANPESISGSAQLMVRDIKCSGCGVCVAVCPEGAIHIDDEGKRRVNWDLCSQCFKCAESCLYGALAVIGETMSVESVVNVVEKDALFYKNSGGGVTISGGEPFFQHEFLKELLISLKENQFHVAVDTTGYTSSVILERMLPLMDLVMLDIKHMDSERHMFFTGVDNGVIHENAKRVAEKVETWFRIPLIKGVNDDPGHITRVADLAESLGVKKVSLLPYHEGGLSKWGRIGKDRPDFQGLAPDDQHIEFLKDIIQKRGVEVGVRS